MNPAPATTDRPTHLDPAPDRSAGNAPVPEGIARLLCLLRWIIDYGTQFATALQQRAAGTNFARIASRYRTSDLAAILTRIRRGLLLAAGLQARLLRRAATGRDVAPAPLRCPLPQAPRAGDPQRQRTPRRTKIIDLPLDRLPTAEQIASELRHRPIGAILVDICRDLGILPGDLTGAQWRELSDVIIEYGGSLAVLLFKEAGDDLRRRVAATLHGQVADRDPGPRVLAVACSTGPP